MFHGIVYCLFNTSNGKLYVGQTTRNLNERWEGHVKLAETKPEKMPITLAIAKHGKDVFARTILCECQNQEELDLAEDSFILELSSLVPNGYNIRRGGYGGKHSTETKEKIARIWRGRKHSLETRDKMSQARTGKRLSKETKEKIASAHRGLKHSEEARQKMSRKAQGRISPRKGVKLSEETKRKISETKKLRFRTRCCPFSS